MANEIIMPKFGQTVEEAEIVKWHKKVGDKIAKGDVILEIQTDKATLEVESFSEGTILKIFAKNGDTVPVMSVIGYIGKEEFLKLTTDTNHNQNKPSPIYQ